MNGCNGVREGCMGVSLPIPYRDSLHDVNTISKFPQTNISSKKKLLETHRYGVETTLSEIMLRSTANYYINYFQLNKQPESNILVEEKNIQYNHIFKSSLANHLSQPSFVTPIPLGLIAL